MRCYHAATAAAKRRIDKGKCRSRDLRGAGGVVPQTVRWGWRCFYFPNIYKISWQIATEKRRHDTSDRHTSL